MKVKRKRGWDASLSNWCDHDSSLMEFIPLSSMITEDVAIEWSSSEDESEKSGDTRKPAAWIQVPVKKLSPSVRKIKEVKDSTTSVKTPHCDTGTGSHFQNLVSDKSTRNSLPVVHEKQTSDLNTRSHQPAHKVTPNEQSADRATIHNRIEVDPLLTSDYICDNDDDLHISQVSGMQDHSTKSCSEINSKDCGTGNNATDTEMTEPSSPILGSQKIIRKPAKMITFPSHEKFTDKHQYRNNEMPGKLKDIFEYTFPSASEVTNVSKNLVRYMNKKRRVPRNTQHFSLQGMQCNFPVMDNQGWESLGDNLKSSCGRVQGEKQTERVHNSDDAVYDEYELEIQHCKNQLQSSVSAVGTPYGKDTYNRKKPQQEQGVTQKTESDVKLKIHSQFIGVRDSLRDETDVTEKEADDIIDNPVSPATSPVPHQESDSQDNYYIDVSVTPPRKLQEDDCIVLSQDSNNPSISSESLPSQAAVNDVVAGNLKSGFVWARNLQQQTTPQKPCERDAEEAVESAKKKPKKDGEAARLRRLLVSWQSSINTWAHQLSLSTLHGSMPPTSSTLSGMSSRKLPLPTPLKESFFTIKAEITSDRSQSSPVIVNNPLDQIKQERMNERNPLSPVSLNNSQSRIKQENSVPDNSDTRKVSRSPAVRNLQDLLIESPASSPGVSSVINHIQIPTSKKYIELQVLRVGSQLTSNSALCEVVSSSEETLLRPIKTEDGNKTKDENASRQRRKFMVFLALQEHKITGPLQVGDTAKVYSPWQTLDIPAHDVPVLFTSYFTLTKALQKGKGHALTQKERVLTTWTCQCSADPSVLPAMCDAQYSASAQGGRSHSQKELLPVVPSTFTTISDTPEDHQLQAGSHTWTVMEGIERCGGASDVPISLTARVHRSIPHRDSGGAIENWVLVCQDATGVFCTIKVPNRPLAKQLSAVLEEGQGRTHTLTHLSILSRLTNTQNHGLFSLISSLHSSYQATVSTKPSLRPLLRPPQTSCYCFTVTLGSTCLLPCQEEVVIPLSLPSWSLHQAFKVRSDGQRGHLSLHVLYMVDSFLYVMDHTNTNHQEEAQDTHSSHQEENGVILDTNHEDNADSWECKASLSLKNCKDSISSKKRISLSSMRKNEEFSAVRRLIVATRSSLPEWIPEQGTVMQRAVLKDVMVWRGNVILDEFSCVHKEKEESVQERVSLRTLLEILNPLSSFTQQHDVTQISGTIVKIDEESAYTWPACPKCGSDKVQEVESEGAGKERAQGRYRSTGVKCSACGVRASTPAEGYSMEVWLSCRPQMEHADVKVKLYQRTIEKLLYSSTTASDEGYDAESLIGAGVGPLVCVLQTVSRHNYASSPTQYFLLEFPY